jgi:hypothetical protein
MNGETQKGISIRAPGEVWMLSLGLFIFLRILDGMDRKGFP